MPASFTEQASDTIAPTGPWHSLDQLQRILRKYQRLSRCAVKNVLAVAAMACPQQVLGCAGQGDFLRSPQQFIERDRQIPHALAGHVINRIGDRRRDADDTNLAYALDA